MTDKDKVKSLFSLVRRAPDTLAVGRRFKTPLDHEPAVI